MTTNCIIEPMNSYQDRLYTRSVVGWPGCKHIKDNDFSAVIAQAETMSGFSESEVDSYSDKTLTIGFGRNAVMGVAGTVIDLVKKGDISHFFLIGGCDGSEGERSYFTDLAKASPDDSILLTLGCGKFRLNNLDLGDIQGIPRVLDMGQCNDSYSAIQVALALADAFETDVNGLPLSFAVSWFEQKAVAVLLTLLHLNVKNIRLGPHLPGFATQNMVDILVDKFQIAPTTDVAVDLPNMLQNK
jgi:hydroxylamine reductase